MSIALSVARRTVVTRFVPLAVPTDSHYWSSFEELDFWNSSSADPTEIEVDIVTLESDRNLVRLAPEWGGRILEWRDKVTGFVALAFPESLDLTRLLAGPTLAQGMGVCVDIGGARANALNCDFLLRESDDENGWSGVELFWMTPGGALSAHIAIALSDSSPAVRLGVSLLNRTHSVQPVDIGIDTPSNWRLLPDSSGVGWVNELGALCASGSFEMGALAPQAGALARFGTDGFLAPRQVDAWQVDLRLGGSAGRSLAWSERVLFAETDDAFEIVARDALPEVKLMALVNGAPLERTSPLDIEAPIRLAKADFSGPVDGLAAIVDGATELRWQRGAERDVALIPLPNAARPQVDWLERAMDASLRGLDPSLDCAQALRFAAMKHGARLAQAAHFAAIGHFLEAAEHIDLALAHNAEDPLTWWAKANAARHVEALSDGPELENAHFLAPLEPLLRVEAALSQPADGSGDGLAQRVAQRSDRAHAVAIALIEAGAIADASRWIDEALRALPSTALRYLMAYLYLHRLDARVEAAHWLSVAASSAFCGAMPMTAMDGLAAEGLAEAFPDDEALGRWLDLTHRLRAMRLG